MTKDVVLIIALAVIVIAAVCFLCLYISAKKKIALLNDEIEKASLIKEESAKAARAKTEFVADMSHEIRVPMNAISCATELLLKEDLSKHAQSYINILKTSSDTLLEMVNGILDFSKMDAGKLSIVDKEYSLRDTIEDAESIIATLLPAENVTLTIDIDPSLPRFLIGDDVRVKQVLINLLKNAAKYTVKGNIALKVDKKSVSDGKITMKVTVTDTGCGIPPADEKRLRDILSKNISYTEFEKEDASIGIYFVNELAKAMEGSLSFTTSLGLGSEFIVEFKQRLSKNPEVIADASVNSQIDVLVWEEDECLRNNLMRILSGLNIAAKTINDEVEISMYLSSVKVDYIISTEKNFDEAVSLINKHSNSTVPVKLVGMYEPADTSFDGNFAVLKRPVDVYKVLDIIKTGAYKEMHSAERIGKLMTPEVRVLVVDDNKVNLKVAKALIESFGATVFAVSSGYEAVNLVKMGEKFDLIFMDHMMPDMDGIEAAHRIWGFEGEKRTPIIALTANAGNEVEKLFNEAGLSDFIPKPIVMKHLNYIMQKWLPKEKQVFLEGDNVSGNRFLRLHSKAIQPDWGLAKVWNDEKIYLGILHVYLEKSVEIFALMKENRDTTETMAKGEELKDLAISAGATRLPELLSETLEILKTDSSLLYTAKLSETMEEHARVCEEISEFLKKQESRLEDILTFT